LRGKELSFKQETALERAAYDELSMKISLSPLTPALYHTPLDLSRVRSGYQKTAFLAINKTKEPRLVPEAIVKLLFVKLILLSTLCYPLNKTHQVIGSKLIFSYDNIAISFD